MFSRVSLFSDGSVHFSPDSKRVAYIAFPKSLNRFVKVMVVDGVAGKEHDDIEFIPRIFSPDSKHAVYTAKIGAKQNLIIDGIEGPLFNRIDYFHFSPDGKHIAYSGVSGNGTVTVCDGKEIAKGAVVFSPDWQHTAYLASKGWGGWMVVHDGKEGLRHTVGETWRTQLFFSPDSQRLAYRTSQAREIEFVVVDGVQSIPYRLVELGNPIFSPDSKHFAYWAAPASGKWHVFVDRAYSEPYDEPVFGSKLVFDGPDTLHALAVRGGEMLRVEIKILAPDDEAKSSTP
jgi:Tol biopolymer transport system component